MGVGVVICASPCMSNLIIFSSDKKFQINRLLLQIRPLVYFVLFSPKINYLKTYKVEASEYAIIYNSSFCFELRPKMKQE